MNAGLIIALLLFLLIAYAIFWFMTRAGRRPAKTSKEVTAPNEVQASPAPAAVSTTTSTAAMATAAGAAAITATAASSSVHDTPNPARADDTRASTSAATALAGDFTVSSGNAAEDVRDMLKVLNLRESDAKRLALSAADYRGLKDGNSALPEDAIVAVADTLRRMIRGSD